MVAPVELTVNWASTKRFVHIAPDLLVLFGAVVCAIITENVVITGILGISAFDARWGSLPQVWIARFVEPLVVLPILTLWLWRNGEDWHTLGLRKPANWRRFSWQVFAGLFATLGIVCVFLYGVVYPFHLRLAPPPYLADTRRLAAALTFTLLGTGLNQELAFRGFLQSRFAKVFGEEPNAWHAAIVMTGIIFGLMHLGVGRANAVMAGLAGVCFGEVYLWADRNLWVVVAAHSLGNAMMLILYSYYQF